MNPTLTTTRSMNAAAAAVAFVVMLVMSPVLLAGVVTLKDHAAASADKLTLADIAELTGEDAKALGSVVIPPAGRINIEDVRRVLTEKGVHWGRITLRGAANVTINAAAPAKPSTPVEKLPGGAVANPAPTVIADQTNDATSQTLRQRIVAWIAQQVGADESDLKVTFENENDALLDVSVGSGRLEFEPLSRDNLGRLPVNIRRYDAASVVSTQRLTARVQLRKSVLVAARTLSKGQTITDTDVEVKSQWLESSLRQPLTHAALAVGQRAATVLRAGSVVYADDVRGQAVIKRGQLVTIRCISGGLTVKTVARAAEDGEIGSTIAVANDRSRETFTVKVTGPQEAVMVLEDKPAVATARVTGREGKR